MKERPILFSGLMVRAILDGRKTQTRRVVKPQLNPEYVEKYDRAMGRAACRAGIVADHSPYHAGDLLWVRETWALPPSYRAESHGDLKARPRIGPACYRADYPLHDPWPGTRWRPSIHMPKWAARIWLRVTDVRVERLQEITEDDARAEGAAPEFEVDLATFTLAQRWDAARASTHRLGFKHLWDRLNASRGYGWGVNPWVWVVSFKRAKAP